ncbi:MAG: hypothetical protein K8W52_19780 [Deltaproteobacteria bacterium]|nr:hypothetical protein [Deltaproteobacteria bacterium]
MLIVVGACASPSKPAPVVTAPVVVDAAAPRDAGAVAAAPVDAAPAAAAPVAPGTCMPDLGAVLPADPALAGKVFYRDGAAMRSGALGVCDTPDRIVMWAHGKESRTRDPQFNSLVGDLIVIARDHVDRLQRASYDKGSGCSHNCEGPAGGHAGCSMTSGCWVESKVLGGARLSLYPEQGYALDRGEAETRGCGPQAYGFAVGTVLGFCSSATHLAVLSGQPCEAGQVLTLTVWDNPADRADNAEDVPVPPPLSGDLDRAHSTGTRWRYVFPAFAGTRGAALSIDVGAAPSATLEVDGASEDCFVFGLNAPRS